MTQVLVTGAAGFIGSTLSEALVRRGYTVRGLDAFTEFYDPERKRQNLEPLSGDPAFELVVGDLRTMPLDEALDGVDLVAHLAGEPGVSGSWGPNFERYVERNVLSTQRLLEAVSGRGVDRLVYASSSSVYGIGANTLRASGEPRPASPYGVTKHAAETLVGAYAGAGLSAVSLRYFSVYGPRQRPDMAAHRFIESLLDGRPLTVYGDGRQERDFTFVEDIVEATIQALFADVPNGAVLDVASSRPTSVNELVSVLEDLVGAESTRDVRGERRGDVPRTAGDIDSARDQLGWKPTVDLRTGLERQIAWHRTLRRTPAMAQVKA